MNARRLDLIWLALVAGTLFTWWLGETGGAGPAAVLAVLGVAGLKGIWIIRDFMALRGVRFLWPALVIGWLLLVLALIAASYWRGLPIH